MTVKLRYVIANRLKVSFETRDEHVNAKDSVCSDVDLLCVLRMTPPPPEDE